MKNIVSKFSYCLRPKATYIIELKESSSSHSFHCLYFPCSNDGPKKDATTSWLSLGKKTNQNSMIAILVR